MEEGLPTVEKVSPRRIEPLPVDKPVLDSPEVKIAKRLKALEVGLGITVFERERKEEIDIGGVKFVRIIDGLANDEEGGLLVDYKTASWPWDVVETEDGYFAPKAHTIQTPAYLYNPSDDDRPERLVYLIAPSRSKKDQSFYVEHDPDREQWFLDVLDEAVTCKEFPANYGYGCKFCTMQDVCLKTNGWEEKYEEKQYG
jgi:CRISPR/Cas system-associated exonuclease Cas4 (RecB family)